MRQVGSFIGSRYLNMLKVLNACQYIYIPGKLVVFHSSISLGTGLLINVCDKSMGHEALVVRTLTARSIHKLPTIEAFGRRRNHK